MIWAIDSDGTPMHIGPEWDGFVMPADLPLRERIWRHVHPDDREMVLSLFREAQTRRLPLVCVFRLKHMDGGYRRMIARGVPTLEPTTGALIGFLGTTYEMEHGDLTVSNVGWTEMRRAHRVGLRCAIDDIADHLLVARAIAEQAGETRLCAIADAALRQIFEPFGLDPILRQ